MLNRKGFTLIELLIVIAIIIIIAAVILPVTVRAKDKSKQAVCISNLKQLWMGWRLYADDNDGRFPRVRAFSTRDGGGPEGAEYNWCGAEKVGGDVYVEKGTIFRYVRSKKSYLCPSDFSRPTPQIKSWRIYPLSYSANWTLSWKRPDTLPPHKISRMLMLIHEDRKTINDGDFNWAGSDIPDNVHFDGTTLIYIDGRATRLCAKKIMEERFIFYDARPSPPKYN